MGKLLGTPTLVWLLLVALTFLALGITEGRLLGVYAAYAIVGIAAVKARLVILHYMEAIHAPTHWRMLYEAWYFTAAAIILMGYTMALHQSG